MFPSEHTALSNGIPRLSHVIPQALLTARLGHSTARCWYLPGLLLHRARDSFGHSSSSKCHLCTETGGHFSRLRDRKVIPRYKHTQTHTHVFVQNSTLEGNSGAGWQRQRPAEDASPALQTAALPMRYRLQCGKNRLGWMELRTKWQCTDRRTFP